MFVGFFEQVVADVPGEVVLLIRLPAVVTEPLVGLGPFDVASNLDYIEAFYDVKPDLAKRSVHPGMTKLGFWREEVTDPYKATAMTYERLLSLSAEWNAKGELASDAPKKVEILDTMDHTACLKVTAEWGTDYMHLVKEDGVWRILQILWQSPVVEAGSEG